MLHWQLVLAAKYGHYRPEPNIGTSTGLDRGNELYLSGDRTLRTLRGGTATYQFPGHCAPGGCRNRASPVAVRHDPSWTTPVRDTGLLVSLDGRRGMELHLYLRAGAGLAPKGIPGRGDDSARDLRSWKFASDRWACCRCPAADDRLPADFRSNSRRCHQAGRDLWLDCRARG